MENTFTYVYNGIMENNSKNIRLFVGTPISLEFLTPALSSKIQEHLNVPMKWVEKENIHITWKFIGDTNPDNIELIKSNLQEAASSANDIVINFKKIEIWPNKRSPRQLVVVGDDTNGNGAKLYSDINHKLVELGITEEKRKFNPHITISRFKNKHIPVMPIVLPDWLEIEELKINISHIDLIQSALTPKGSIYTVLKSYQL